MFSQTVKTWLAVATLIAVSIVAPARAQLSFEPSWQLPAYDDVRGEVFEWIDQSEANAELKQEARSLWPSVALREMDGPALLDSVVETAALLNSQVAELVKQSNAEVQIPKAPDVSWVEGSNLPEFVQQNLRLYVARWLGQQAMYDEVLETVGDIKPDDVVDPASLLFYRMVAYHQIVEPDQSRVALVELLEHEDQLPVRYRQIAEMIRQDLAGLKDESLDHISRRMNDVRRRLQLGEAGKTVQVVEKGVSDSLDKMIKKIEEQQKQQQSGGGGAAQGSAPMQDSQLPAMQAPGKVDPSDIGHKSGWGDLPPKEREEALQQIGREFPAHYRQLIEQYFRDLADQSTNEPQK